MEILRWRMSLAFLAVLAFAMLMAFSSAKPASAVPVLSHPEISVERTACDELTLTVTTYISHPNEDTGHYTLITGWLNDGLPPAEYPVPTGQDVYVYTEVIDLPFDGDTFRAVLEIKGGLDDPSDELVVTDTDEICADLTIVKDTSPESDDPDFNFTGDLGAFELEDDDSLTFSDLEPGTYLVRELAEAGWVLVDTDCVGASTSDNDVDDGDVAITLSNDADAICTFVNEAVVPPTTVPPTAVPPTAVPATPVVIVQQPVIIQQVAPTAVPAKPIVVTQIRPPSTGDAGIR